MANFYKSDIGGRIIEIKNILNSYYGVPIAIRYISRQEAKELLSEKLKLEKKGVNRNGNTTES